MKLRSRADKHKQLILLLSIFCVVQNLYYQWIGLSYCSNLLPVRGNDDGGKIAVSIKDPYTSYKGAQVEEYLMEHADDLGFNTEKNPPGCSIWKDKSPILQSLTAFRDDLKRYQQLVHDFPDAPQDVRKAMKTYSVEEVRDELKSYQQLVHDFPDAPLAIRKAMKTSSVEEVCSQLKLHPDGLPGIFKSGQLSYTRSGWVEPLLTPLRDPEFCFEPKHLMSMGYLVEDFARMCRSLKPTSKIVLIDIGAALDFHGNKTSPAIYLTKTYRKFGFYFDHIYAFEIDEKITQEVYDRIPDELMASYHWINLGVDAKTDSKFNPLHSILRKFDKDDLVIVKLDIDVPFIEVPLAYQLLNDTSLSDLVDQFYFEHHVHLGELASYWVSMNGTIKSSLELVRGLRKNGVAAHFWP